MTLKKLLEAIVEAPTTINFSDVMDVIQASYAYQATEFRNGLGNTALVNLAGNNEGSCKIFAFAQIHQ